MVKFKFFFLAFLLLAACGRHDISNFGYTKELKAQEGDKAVTWLDFMENAIDQVDVDQFNELLNDTTDINSLLKNGRTPLTHATSKKLVPFVYQLIQKGAALDVVDTTGKTAMQYATELNTSGEFERIIYFLTEPLLQQELQKKMQEELIAVITADGDEVSLQVENLLKKGVNPNFTDVSGETPLTLALKVMSLSSSLLINWKDPEAQGLYAVDVNLANQIGEKPLTVILANPKPKHPKVKAYIKALIEQGATE